MERIRWLQVALAQGIGPKIFWEAINKQDLLEKKGVKLPSHGFVEDILARHEKAGIQVICAYEDDFPNDLKAIATCPPFLFFKGNKDLFHKNKFAVVGARNVSLHGRKITYGITSQLKDYFTIVSGFAKGADTSAHEASAQVGTIAVFACGLDTIYPAENRALYHKILEHQGLIISEKMLGAKPTPQSFPARNRIIAGLAKGILVVEAAYNSGSLITAHLAAEYGRDIFVVPGSPIDPRSKGSNKLIKDGAILTQDASDILCHYDLNHQFIKQHKTKEYAPKDHAEILKHLSFDCADPEELLNILKIDINELSGILSELEIKGLIVRDAQGRVSLKT